MYYAAKDALGAEAALVWYQAANLEDYDAILLPGGFSYGDYLRSVAIAAASPIVAQLKKQAEKGVPILGVCNGFQVLLEAGLLPGAMIRNKNLKFMCHFEELIVENATTMFTLTYQEKERIALPIAHGEGNYYCDQK